VSKIIGLMAGLQMGRDGTNDAEELGQRMVRAMDLRKRFDADPGSLSQDEVTELLAIELKMFDSKSRPACTCNAGPVGSHRPGCPRY
jgi:hypothetical protein